MLLLGTCHLEIAQSPQFIEDKYSLFENCDVILGKKSKYSSYDRNLQEQLYLSLVMKYKPGKFDLLGD
jgi:hypothetical protein